MAQAGHDWKKGRITVIPLSGQVNRIVSINGQSVHFFFRAQYNVKNASGQDKWTLAAAVSLLGRQ